MLWEKKETLYSENLFIRKFSIDNIIDIDSTKTNKHRLHQVLPVNVFCKVFL